MRQRLPRLLLLLTLLLPLFVGLVQAQGREFTVFYPLLGRDIVLTPRCVTPPEGLVAWWPMDANLINPVVRDIAPAGVVVDDGQPFNVTSVSGVVGGAIAVDGANGSYVEVPNSPDLNPGEGDFTIDAWILPKRLPIWVATIVDKTDGRNRYTLHLEFSDGRYWLGSRLDSGGASYNYLAPLPSDFFNGQWRHVAVVVHRQTLPATDPSRPVLEFYVDGTLIGTVATPSSQSFGSLDSDAPLLIGRHALAPSAGSFRGRIDELEFFRRALTASEIQAIYRAKDAGKCKFTPTPTSTPTPTLTPTPTPAPAATICVLKFHDVDGNGQWSPGQEPLMPGWTINVRDAAGNLVGTMQTIGTDYRCIEVKAPGTYTVSEQVQSGWTPTTPPGGSTTVTVQPGQTVNIAFGNRRGEVIECIQPPGSLVAWWPMDANLINPVVRDIAPAGGVVDDGQPFNVTSVNGVVGGAIAVDGANGSYVEVPSSPDLNPGEGDFTIDAWILPEGPPAWVATIVDKTDGINRYTLHLEFWNGRYWLGSRLDSGGASYNYLAPLPSDFFNGQWRHVAVVVHRQTLPATDPSKPVLEFYVDGTLIGTVVTPSSQSFGSLSSNAPLLIGRHALAPSAGSFRGRIDELEFFRRALTASEIQAIYRAKDAGKCKPTPTPTPTFTPTTTPTPTATPTPTPTPTATATPTLEEILCPCPDVVLPPNTPVTITLNTGFEAASGTLIPYGSPDDNWIVVQDPLANTNEPRRADVVLTPGTWWPAPFANSRWISILPNGAHSRLPEPPSQSRYRYCFCLPPGVERIRLTARLWADDRVRAVYLNGQLVGGPGGSFLGNPLVLSITDPALFRAGRNCLDVVVEDTHLVVTGLDVEGNVTYISPP